MQKDNCNGTFVGNNGIKYKNIVKKLESWKMSLNFIQELYFGAQLLPICLGIGMNDYIGKPYKEKELLDKIENLLK